MQPQALGRHEDGSFRTTVLKTYPAALCEFMAMGFRDWWMANLKGEEHLEQGFVPDDVSRFFMPLDPFFNFQKGSDYAQHGTRTRKAGEKESVSDSADPGHRLRRLPRPAGH